MPSPIAALDTPHLLVPYAHASDPACTAALGSSTLPHLAQLLTALAPMPQDLGTGTDWTPPHERALARALGLAPAVGPCPDGQLPWAAWATQTRGPACAWFTPCHWQAGMDQVTVQPPEGLLLDPTDEQALLNALAPFCAEDGITLTWHGPSRWLACGPVFEGVRTASLDRVAHRRPDAWLPQGAEPAATRMLLRLMNEAQMLFYTHPVSDQRQDRGLPPINGLWIHGAGRWSADNTSGQQPKVLGTLQAPALQGDWMGWTRAWQQLDAGLQNWVNHVQAGHPLQITLCGERHAQTWGPAQPPAPGWWARHRPRWLGGATGAPAWLPALTSL